MSRPHAKGNSMNEANIEYRVRGPIKTGLRLNRHRKYIAAAAPYCHRFLPTRYSFAIAIIWVVLGIALRSLVGASFACLAAVSLRNLVIASVCSKNNFNSSSIRIRNSFYCTFNVIIKTWPSTS